MKRIIKTAIDSCFECPIYNNNMFTCPDFPEDIWESDDPEALLEQWFENCKRWEKVEG